MDLNSYEHSGHYFCKLVQRLQKQEYSQQQCMAHIISNPSLLSAWCDAEYKQAQRAYMTTGSCPLFK